MFWRREIRVLEDRNSFHDLLMDLRRARHEYGIMERIRADTSFGSPGIKVRFRVKVRVRARVSSRGGDEDEVDEEEDEEEDIPLKNPPI